MKFLNQDAVMRWAGPAIIVAIGVDIIVGNPLTRATMCDATQNCLATWVSALSGWAALAGALWTVGVMQEQLAEQRRQTEHMMGNGPPEIFVEPHMSVVEYDAFSELKVTVINRNRRPLRLHQMLGECAEGVSIGIKETTIAGSSNKPLFSDWITETYVHRTIPGKEDGQPAQSCIIICHVLKEKSLAKLARDPEHWRTNPVTVRISCFQKESKDVPIELIAHGETQT